MKNPELNIIKKAFDNNIFKLNNSDEENTECGGIDSEIKKIFDGLRLVGSPQHYSLNEVLIKAINAEKELLENKVKISKESSSFSIFKKHIKFSTEQVFKVWERNFQPFQFQFATILLLTLGITCFLWILPSKIKASDKTNLEYPITGNSKFLLVENIK